jgi:hypothetical protein
MKMSDEIVSRPNRLEQDLAAFRREQADAFGRAIALLEEILDNTRWLSTSRTDEPDRPCPPSP